MKEKTKIAMILDTGGLEYDDRVRKEILSIQKIYPNVSFKAFVRLPQNMEEEGVSSYGTPYKSLYIKAREKYPSSTKLFLKGYQLYKNVKHDLRSFDVIWTVDVESAFVTLFYKTDSLIWDLHELPMRFMDKWWKRMVLKYMFSRCKAVIHASPQRIKCLSDMGLISNPEKHFALRNYQSDNEGDHLMGDETFDQFVRWKGERKCVYLQGLGGDSRASYETIASVMRTPDLYAVVLGNFDKDAHAKLKREFRDLTDRVFFTGLILQQYIEKYVEQCYMSIVFYKNISLNNWYCDSNRLYLSILKGLPVVVGNNPTMKDIVEQYGLGVSIDDDGHDENKIRKGINDVMAHYDEYRKNALSHKEVFLWESQEHVIKEFMDIMLKRE